MKQWQWTYYYLKIGNYNQQSRLTIHDSLIFLYRQQIYPHPLQLQETVVIIDVSKLTNLLDL
jgi:hypothetical protein